MRDHMLARGRGEFPAQRSRAREPHEGLRQARDIPPGGTTRPCACSIYVAERKCAVRDKTLGARLPEATDGATLKAA